MRRSLGNVLRCCVLAGLVTVGSPKAYSIEYEIHVYDDGITNAGTLNLTVHSNYIASGSDAPAYPGATVPDQSLTGGTEWSYGVLPWLECGVYFPVYTLASGGRLSLDGVEVRALVLPGASPDTEHSFFYGVDLAMAFERRVLSDHSVSSEVQPIWGAHWGAFTLSLDPNLDLGFEGSGSVEFSPSERLQYAWSPALGLALEHYSALGQVQHLEPIRDTTQKLFAVLDRKVGRAVIEAGAGWGLTRASDPLTLKLIVSIDLH